MRSWYKIIMHDATHSHDAVAAPAVIDSGSGHEKAEGRAGAQTRARGRDHAARILDAAIPQFAAAGYEGARVESVAAAAGMAKGSVFFHFGSKRGLFLAAYRRAARSLPRYLDAPLEVRDSGFFGVVRYWLTRTEHLVHEDWIPYRMTLLGTYSTDPALRRDINRFLIIEDPFGTRELVLRGIGRGEVRRDLDVSMVSALVDWLMDRFQDQLVTDELAPGLLSGPGDFAERNRTRIEQFVGLLRDAVGAREGRSAGSSEPAGAIPARPAG